MSASKERGGNLSRDVGEGVAVEEEERRAAVTLPEELYEFGQGQGFSLVFFPLSPAGFLSFSMSWKSDNPVEPLVSRAAR